LRKRDGGGKWRVAEKAVEEAGCAGSAKGERGMKEEGRCNLKAGGRTVPADTVDGAMVRVVDDPNMMIDYAAAADVAAGDIAEMVADVAVQHPSAASHS
jgi:hypothetical protein